MNSFVSELLAQLGSYRRLKMFIGAYAFVNSHQKLSFKFKGSKRFNCCTIALNDSDFYDLTFYKLVRKGGLFQELEDATVSVKNIYGDQLLFTFQEQTGLLLSFTKATSPQKIVLTKSLIEFG
jgi:hypothetical protein